MCGTHEPELNVQGTDSMFKFHHPLFDTSFYLAFACPVAGGASSAHASCVTFGGAMSALDSPPGWPVGLPLPDLSRPPPWLLPPPPPGNRPPSPPAGGWARNWQVRPLAHGALGAQRSRPARAACQEAVPWPPPLPEGPPEACWPGAAEGEGPRRKDGADWDVTAEPDFETEEAYEYAQPGEVLWRAGDDLEEDEESGEAGPASESVLELSDEWAARFAATELRRALRTCLRWPRRRRP